MTTASVDLVLLDVDPEHVKASQRVPHLNRATARAAEYGTTVPAHDLGDDK